MKKQLVASVIVLLFPFLASADEGMWPLPTIKQRIVQMQALGLALNDYDIYNPDSTSLKDAVVIFGGGCTGEIVSPEGLLFTNHHCGYGQIQSHSTVEHNYLQDGFWAMSRSEELPCPGLKVTFIDQIEDVTNQVLDEIKKSNRDQDFLSTSYLDSIAKEILKTRGLEKEPGIDAEIRAFYGGNQYYLFIKKIYNDVRLVGAPPSSIGKFGADTDNWMWPRHTGDFSIFRVYADTEGKPASYSTSNIPLRPKCWFKLSTEGVEEGDFGMMMGFPGRTNQYYTSWEIAERRDIDNTTRVYFRDIRQQAMLKEMLADPSINIQYAGKYASSANAYKNAMGSNWAIKRYQLVDSAELRQNLLKSWANEVGQLEYIEAIDQLEEIVKARSDFRYRSWVLDEAIVRGVEFASAPSGDALLDALKGDNKSKMQNQLKNFEKNYRKYFNQDYSSIVDCKVAKIMLKEYAKVIPKDQHPVYLAQLENKYKGDIDKLVDEIFEQSIYGSEQNFSRFMANPSAKKLQNDPMIQFSKSVSNERKALSEALKGFDQQYNIAHRTFVKGLLAIDTEETLFPDANFTIRLTYGQAKGYKPRDVVDFQYQTTLDGVMEKEDSTSWEFVVPPKLKSLYRENNFGHYKRTDGKMPVCFTMTTHTTGGNSGSPVLNKRGELIGLNFDRNWEGVGGDLKYLPDYQRSIIVDIRYVLFLIDKYANASYLLNELDITE